MKIIGLKILCFVICSTVVSASIYDEAEIYFSFEGSSGTTTNASAWQNYGTKGFEKAYAIGSDGGVPSPTVSASIAIRGQAYDNSGATASSDANALQYGSLSNLIGQETERALYNVWSYTWCGWVKQGIGGTPQGRLFNGSSTLEMNYRGDRVEYRVAPLEATGFRPAYFSTNSIEAGTEWVFLAVVYDGTITNGSANTFVYAGDENESVGLIDSSTNNFGRLDRDPGNGASFFIGNAGVTANRPFVGYMDEVRIYGDGTQNDILEAGYGDSALDMSQLEEIRLHDLGPIDRIYDQAGIHFSFEGASGTTTNAPAWQNYGTKGLEKAFAIGSNGSVPYPTVSLGTAIRGQAYDNSGATASSAANGLQYGSLSTLIEQETERVLYNVWSYTWCGWVKQGVEGSPQGRLFNGNSTLEMNYRGNRVEYRVAPLEGTGFRPAYFSVNSIEAGTNWVFLAVVYDGTITNGSANTFVYAGDEDKAVGLIDSATNNFASLNRSPSLGASFYLGNSGTAGTRPFVGYMDEIRIYGDGGLSESGRGESALSVGQLETIRQYDLFLLDNYGIWIHDFPGVGSSTNKLDNPDGDVVDNLAEWALGGDPSDPSNTGDVSSEIVEDAGTWLEMVHAQRKDAENLGLSYHTEQAVNLQSPIWTNAFYETTGTNITGGSFDFITNRLSTTAEESQFLRLRVESE